MGAGIRRARAEELGAVVALIARAFAGEPFMNWVAGGDADRLRRFVRLAVHRIAAPDGEVLVDDDVAAAALVLPPGGLEAGPLEQLRRLPELARCTGTWRLPLVLRGLVRLERAHPGDPYATLLTLGVEPSRQGEGCGSAMLCALAARSAAPLYLETCSQRNVALYECHGYVVTRELALPGGGPLVWTMVSDGAAPPGMPPVP
jgi:ribosomal protein S18 acetylase RimI-like enzyme